MDRKELYRYLGIKDNNPSDNMIKIIDECESEILKIAYPRYVYKFFDLTLEDNTINIVNTNLSLKGKSIYNHLKDCQKVILLCATVSLDVDNLIKKAQATDVTKAFIYDNMGSVLVEQVCDNIENIIKDKNSDYYFTTRFSPGYGDLTIDIQNLFLEVTNAKKQIGLTANESSILIPRKSVTAIIGLSKNPIQNKIPITKCDNCSLKDTCQIRIRGENCEF